MYENYMAADEDEKANIRDAIYGFFLEEASGDMIETEALIQEALRRYTQQEDYEHCKILKDILDEFGTFY